MLLFYYLKGRGLVHLRGYARKEYCVFGTSEFFKICEKGFQNVVFCDFLGFFIATFINFNEMYFLKVFCRDAKSIANFRLVLYNL